MHLFMAEKDDIGTENAYFWDVNIVKGSGLRLTVTGKFH